ncbi:Hypothetical_protein [Hexamita inflata]|uniref:Hypothetical_protein n=1 Tax=Hexamita inflata TaxID=28002 RepID=A0AA86U4S9_9EUKA|nr:Hypothetical protein HINF_LOCUS30195 [Hexamita inflata]
MKIEVKAPNKTKRKSNSLKVTRSKDHQKVPIHHKVYSKGNKSKRFVVVLENPVKSKPKYGQNEQKRQLMQNRKPSQSQRKKLQIEYQELFLKKIELRKISTQLKPRKQLIHYRQYTPKFGICENKYTKKEPNQVNETIQIDNIGH